MMQQELIIAKSRNYGCKKAISGGWSEYDGSPTTPAAMPKMAPGVTTVELQLNLS